MRIRITMPTKDGKRLKEQITGAADTVEEDDFTSDEWETVRRSPVRVLVLRHG
jgi:ribosome maturation protein SDO1